MAVLAVIAFHINPRLFPSGYLGVDLFFVISGFVVTPLIVSIFHFESGEEFQFSAIIKRLTYFYKRRFLRLTPAVGFMLLIFIPILLIVGDFSLIKRLADQTIASLLLLGNYGAYKFAGDYFNPGIPNPFIHTWSLSVEEQFYIFYPLLLIFLAIVPVFGKGNIRRTRITLLIVGSISLFLFIDSNLLIPLYSKFFAVPQVFTFYSPITRLWQFALGGILALGLKQNSTKIYLGNTGRLFLAIALSVSLFFTRFPNLTVAALLSSIFAALAISFKVLDALPANIAHALIWVGDRSYSIYLIHLPLIYLLLESPYTSKFPILVRTILYPLTILLIFIGGDFIFKKVEEKYRITSNANIHIDKDNRLRTVSIKFQITPLLLAVAILATVAQGFFGLIGHSTIAQEGDTFQKYCVRESFVRQFPCRFKGPSTGKKLLLLGDSHAAQYSLDIWRLGVANGFEVYFGGDFGGEVSSSTALQTAKSLRPRLIIASKYWKVSSGKLLPGIDTALQEFNFNAGRLVIIGQNPIYKLANTLPTRATLLSAIFGSKPKLGNRVEKLSNLDFQAQLGGRAISAWAQSHKIEIIDPSPFFCTDQECRRWEPSGWLYIDNNHLSTLGASKLHDVLAKTIKVSAS